MKSPLRYSLLVLTLCGGVAAHAAPATAGLDVVVAKSSGAVAFKGKTDSAGNFSTGALPGGSYIVQFNSANPGLKGKQLSIAASGGKRNVTANAVAGEKFGGGGVAMKVDVAKGSSLTGKVVTGALATAQPAAAQVNAAQPGTDAVRANVKVMNGKRYVWVPGPVGSQIRGRWVEEGSEAARLSTSNKKGEDAEVLRRFQDGSGQGTASDTSIAGGGVWNRGGVVSGSGGER